MRVEMHRFGGIHPPATQMSCAVSTADLSSELADELTELLREAELAPQPAETADLRHAPGQFEYEIEVEEHGQRRQFVLRDVGMTQACRALVRWLQTNATRTDD